MTLDTHNRDVLDAIEADGLYKHERILTSPQGAHIKVQNGTPAAADDIVNFCANNYLGLADDPGVIAAAKQALDDHGFGLASVRFICGTQDLHKQLETRIASFFGTDDAILYSSCFDANGGLFETVLDEHDVVISDALNHASIIDGIRLCRAERRRYAHADMDALETQLKASAQARIRLIVTDGVFSMDGDIAPLDVITELAARYDAQVMVDDSHATGFVGPTGRGSAEHHGVQDRIAIFTSTLGKALGGASGGFTTASTSSIALLRQRSRPYLFSNTIAPPIAAAAIHVFDTLDERSDLREKVMHNAHYFRDALTAAGFDIRPGIHPIVPVMLYDARLATAMATELLELGIYVIGFSYPVVPKGEARIRVQLSAAHTRDDLDRAIDAFVTVARRHGLMQ